MISLIILILILINIKIHVIYILLIKLYKKLTSFKKNTKE